MNAGVTSVYLALRRQRTLATPNPAPSAVNKVTVFQSWLPQEPGVAENAPIVMTTPNATIAPVPALPRIDDRQRCRSPKSRPPTAPHVKHVASAETSVGKGSTPAAPRNRYANVKTAQTLSASPSPRRRPDHTSCRGNTSATSCRAFLGSCRSATFATGVDRFGSLFTSPAVTCLLYQGIIAGFDASLVRFDVQPVKCMPGWALARAWPSHGGGQ
jgi:hypothetical protein